MPRSAETTVVAVYEVAKGRKIVRPLSDSTVPAGFPSPTDDYREKLDLAAHIVRNEASTFFMRVQGDSMTGKGIFDGDLIVVDKSLEPKNGDVVIAVLSGEFTVKTFRRINGHIELWPENERFRKITVAEGQELEIWGVVTGCYRDFR